MTENKAIKLEPGDYILEYDTAKVAKAELMSMVEGLCERGIRLWLVRSIGGDALRIVPKESAKKEDVTPEPSQQVQNVTQGGSVCNPKREEQSPPQEPYFVDGKVQKLVSDNIGELFAEIPPEKEEEPNQLMREYQDQFPSIYRDIKDQAIVDYKKRLVEKLRAEMGDWPDFSSENMRQYAYLRDNGMQAAIKLVNETF